MTVGRPEPYRLRAHGAAARDDLGLERKEAGVEPMQAVRRHAKD